MPCGGEGARLPITGGDIKRRGDSLTRAGLCHEAIRLTSLLAKRPAGNQPKTHALLALMLLNSARLPTRVDDEGNLLRLQEQDRKLNAVNAIQKLKSVESY